MATLREQFKQFKNEGTVEQAKQKLRNFYGVTDVSLLVPYLDTQVEEVKELLKPVGPPLPENVPEQPVTAAQPAKVVAPTPEPEMPVAGLPAPVTPSPEVEPSPLLPEPKKPETGLIDYQGTVRVPFLEEVGLLSPYKGKQVTLELGPSVEKLAGMVGGGIESTSKYAATFLEAMASPFTKPLTEKEEDPVRERARQKRLKRVLDVAKAFDQAQFDRVKRGEESGFIGRAGEDIKEVVLGLATIFHETVGIQAKNANISRMEAGKQFGEQMGEGLAVITGQVFGAGAKEEPNPLFLGTDVLARSFIDKPLTTVITVLPIIQVAKGIPGLRGPAVEAEAGLKGLWQKSKQPIPFNKVSDLVNKVPGVKGTENFFKRLLKEPATMETAAETRIAERVIEEPRIARQKTEAMAARAAREVSKEGFESVIKPEETTRVVRTFDPEAAGEAAMPFSAEVMVNDPLMSETTMGLKGVVEPKRFAEIVKERASPEEYAAFERTLNELDALESKKIKIQDRVVKAGVYVAQEAQYILDTGLRGGLRAVLKDKLKIENWGEVSNQIVDFARRIQQRRLERPVSVLRAGILEILNDYVGVEPSPTQLNAMVRSTQRALLRQNLEQLVSEVVTGSAEGAKSVSEVFEVTPNAVNRLPRARQLLAEDAMEIVRGGIRAAEEAEVLKEFKLEARDRNVANKELREMAERKITERRMKSRLAMNEFESFKDLVDYVYKQVKNAFPGKELEGTPFSRVNIAGRVLQAVSQETVSLLRDPVVAKKVRNDLLQAARKAGVPRAAQKKLVTSFNDFIGDTAGLKNEAVFPEFTYNGEVFYGKSDLLNSFGKLTKKERTAAVEHATTKIGFEIAAEVELAKQVGALQQEVTRFVTEQNVNSPDRYAIEMAVRVIGQGEARPLIMPHNGEQVAAALRGALRSETGSLAELLSEKTGMPKELAEQRIQDLAKYVSRFDKMDRTIRPLTQQRVAGIPYPRGLSGAYANPAFARSVFWDLAAKTGAIQSGAANWLVSVGNMFKRNVVARSTPSLINNNISNTLGVAGRRGVTPPQVLYSVARFNNRLRKYLAGEKPAVDAPRIEVLRHDLVEALDKEGLFGSNDVRQDFTRAARSEGILKGKGPLREFIRGEVELAQTGPVARAGEKVRAAAKEKLNITRDAGEFFEYTYTRFGDDVYKGESAFHRGNKALRQLDETQVGFDTRFENSTTTHWQVKKTGPDTFEARLYDNKGKPRGKKFEADLNDPVSRKRLMKVLARDGLLYGNKLFFDYGKVGNWTKVLRALPITNLTSSFHTWFFKALDIPFVKKGLVYETFIATDTIPSTDPAIMAKNARSDAALSARRAIIANSTTGANAQRREQKDIRTPLSFSPSRQELAFVVASTHPDYVLQYALGSRDYTDPTVMGLKAIQKSLLMFRDDDAKVKELFPPKEKLQKMTPAEWARLQRQRKLFFKTMDGTVLSPKEALELVGIGGSIALNFYDYIREAEQQGKVIDLPGVYRNFGKAMVGSNVARLVDIAIAGGVEAEVLPDFAQRYTRLGKQEMRRGYRSGQANPNQSDFIQYAIKEAFGVGWNSIMYVGGEDEITGRPTTGAMKRYVAGLKKELKANLVKPKEDQARRMKAKADFEQDPKKKAYLEAQAARLSFEAEQIDDAIKNQAELYEDRFEMALNSLYQKSKGIPKPPK